jgi:hypothetical protein
MSLSRVGGSSVAATSVAIPTHVAGDLIVIWAYRDGSTTPPTVPTAGGTVPTFTTIDGPTGANACSAVCAYAVAAGATDTSGTWTNATGISVEVWRGAASPPIGGHAQSGASVATGGNIAIPAIVLTDTSGTSTILAFAGWQNVTAWNTAPAGYTQRSQVATECEALTKDSTTADGTFNVSGTASATGGTRTQQIEIIADLGNRVSQEALEVLYATAAALARTSQVAIEALYSTGATNARTSQLAVETLARYPIVAARVSQVAVEILKARADVRNMDFIASVTVVHAPTLVGNIAVPFIASTTVVRAPTLVAPSTDVAVPFIPSVTVVYGVWNLFNPNLTFSGPGNGGEVFGLRLNENGVTTTATLVTAIGVGGTPSLTMTGDSGMPTDATFVVTIDSEQILVSPQGAGAYLIRQRPMGNTTAASHSAGSTVSWGDSYDMSIISQININKAFTSDIEGTGSHTYTGWLMVFDSTQAYKTDGTRFPLHVTEFMGVFLPGAGVSGASKVDGSQPSAIHAPEAASDHCGAALTVPALIITDIVPGDALIARYTNPASFVLDLGPRSGAIQSWFGLKRVDTSNNDVTLTNPNGICVDTNSGYATYTGSVNTEPDEPLALATGIAKDSSDAAGHAIPTAGPVPWLTVTLPGADRYFTDSIHFSDPGWPIGVLTCRQGNRRVPFWQSWDWHNFTYVYSGFGPDDSFAQVVVNRNGMSGVLPIISLPGPQDIDGPDAYWDDGTYYFGASWYVVLIATPYLVIGPIIGGGGGPGTGPGGGGGGGTIPGVSFPPSGGPPVIVPPVIEGGSGGDITPSSTGLHVWQLFG